MRTELLLKSRRKPASRSCFARTATRAASHGQWVLETSCYSHELLEETPFREGEAQRRVGELLWLMSRTRPDLQYVVALMASRVSKNPSTR